MWTYLFILYITYIITKKKLVVSTEQVDGIR